MAIVLYLIILALIGLSYLTYRAKSTYLQADSDIYNTLQFGALLWISLVASKVIRLTFAAMGWDLTMSDEAWLLIDTVLLVGGGIFVISALVTWLKRLVDSRSEYYRLEKKNELLELAPQLAGLPRGYERLVDQLQAGLRALFAHSLCRFRVIGSISEAEEAYGEEHACILQSGTCVYLTPLASNQKHARALLPVSASYPVWGVVTLDWIEREGDSVNDVELLQRLTRLLNVRPTNDGLPEVIEESRNSELRERLRELAHDQHEVKSLEQAVPLLYSALHCFAGFEILRLGVFEARGSIVRQYCLGPNGNLLNELDRSVVAGVTEMRQLFSSMEFRRCSNLAESKHDDLRFLGTCGAEWSLSIPLGNVNCVDAVLTLAGSGRKIADEDAKVIAEEATAAILPIIRSDNLKRELDLASRNFLKLGNALKLQSQARTPEHGLQVLADCLVAELPASLCQIWTCDHANQTITPVARAQAKSIAALVRVAQPVPLAETRWHHKVVDKARYMVVSQQDQEFRMDDHEVGLTSCPQMKSALILPIMSRDAVAGVITISEVRDHSRRSFTLTDIKLAQGIALIAAQVLAQEPSRQIAHELRERLDSFETNYRVGEIFADLPRRLATPLTSIMARSELLLQSVGDSDSEANRNLQVIKKQAQRITSAIQALTECRHNEIALKRTRARLASREFHLAEDDASLSTGLKL